MPNSGLKQRIQDDMKAAMRAGDKVKLGAVRLIMAAIKQREVDERIELSDEQIIAILDKMAKQRKESIDQFLSAGRDDLVEQENIELGIIKEYLPQPLSETEVQALIDAAIKDSNASSIKDMGKVMGALKPQLQGRADMSKVSADIKSRLA